MPDWKSRLAVSFTDTNNNRVDIKPITSFTPSFSLNAEALHSIEETHVGVVYSPQAMSFSMTVPAVGDVVARLTKLALEGTRFNVTLQETDDGDDWSLESVVMTDCIITSATPTAATVSGVPSATFSGFSLSSTVTGKAGIGPVSVP